jgi:hypothetical protein
MFCGSLTPSPLPSTPAKRQVLGMNCMGPTARSKVVSRSSKPWSVSVILAVPFDPSSGMPMMPGWATPAESSWLPPNRAWLLSTRPMAPTSGQSRWQEGSAALISLAAWR